MGLKLIYISKSSPWLSGIDLIFILLKAPLVSLHHIVALNDGSL